MSWQHCRTDELAEELADKHLQLKIRGESSLSSSFFKPKLELDWSNWVEFQKFKLFRTRVWVSKLLIS